MALPPGPDKLGLRKRVSHRPWWDELKKPMEPVGKLKPVRFYGDQALRGGPDAPVMVLESEDEIVVCDYTEAGAHVCGGLAKHPRFKVVAEHKPLRKLVWELPPETPVSGPGVDLWADFIKRHGVKTIGDLRRLIESIMAEVRKALGATRL